MVAYPHPLPALPIPYHSQLPPLIHLANQTLFTRQAIDLRSVKSLNKPKTTPQRLLYQIDEVDGLPRSIPYQALVEALDEAKVTLPQIQSFKHTTDLTVLKTSLNTILLVPAHDKAMKVVNKVKTLNNPSLSLIMVG